MSSNHQLNNERPGNKESLEVHLSGRFMFFFDQNFCASTSWYYVAVDGDFRDGAWKERSES
jgi:hypothetical protein